MTEQGMEVPVVAVRIEDPCELHVVTKFTRQGFRPIEQETTSPVRGDWYRKGEAEPPIPRTGDTDEFTNGIPQIAFHCD